MPNPTVQPTEGLCLGTISGGVVTGVTVANSASVNTNSFQPTSAQPYLKFFVNSTFNGTVTIYRVDAGGTAQAQGTASTITANNEARFTITNPGKSAYYLTVANTSGSSGTVYAEVYSMGTVQ